MMKDLDNDKTAGVINLKIQRNLSCKDAASNCKIF